MATAKIQVAKVCTLVLNTEEVDYLSGLLQNYRGAPDEQEHYDHKKLRGQIWEAINDANDEPDYDDDIPF